MPALGVTNLTQINTPVLQLGLDNTLVQVESEATCGRFMAALPDAGAQHLESAQRRRLQHIDVRSSACPRMSITILQVVRCTVVYRKSFKR